MQHKISLWQQIDEARRELDLRKEAYPKWVAAGRLSQEQADRQVARMEAILQTLGWLQRNETRIREALGAK